MENKKPDLVLTNEPNNSRIEFYNLNDETNPQITYMVFDFENKKQRGTFHLPRNVKESVISSFRGHGYLTESKNILLLE